MTPAQPRTSTPQLHPHVAAKVHALAPDPETRILDLGCGSGALLERLAGMGYRQLTGVDIRGRIPRRRFAMSRRIWISSGLMPQMDRLIWCWRWR